MRPHRIGEKGVKSFFKGYSMGKRKDDILGTFLHLWELLPECRKRILLATAITCLVYPLVLGWIVLHEFFGKPDKMPFYEGGKPSVLPDV